MIRVLFFARIRDQLGVSDLEIELTEGVHNLSQFTAHLISENPAFGDILTQPNVLVAINQEFGSAETTVEDGDEIAYFPPVTGG